MSFGHRNGICLSTYGAVSLAGNAESDCVVISTRNKDLANDIQIDCTVKVKGLKEDFQYGCVVWLSKHRNEPFVGLHMVSNFQ